MNRHHRRHHARAERQRKQLRADNVNIETDDHRLVRLSDVFTDARCGRCDRQMPPDDNERWNIRWSRGVITGFLCPECQTPEENAEAEVHEALFDYEKNEVIDGRIFSALREEDDQ
jgi:hypothetical protein